MILHAIADERDYQPERPAFKLIMDELGQEINT